MRTMTGAIRQPDLKLNLPSGWTEHANPGGPLEYRPKQDGSTGLLQVSRISDNQFGFISGHEKLGPFAAEMGSRMTGWGKPLGNRDAPCSMGRLGMAIFGGGEYPGMILWLSVSDHSAYMWTWLGPDPKSEEVAQALQVVVAATERVAPVSENDREFLDSLAAMSLAKSFIAQGKSPEQFYLAMLVDDDGKPSGRERPVLSARFEHQSNKPDSVSFRCRFEEAPQSEVTIRLTLNGELESAYTVDRSSKKETELGDKPKIGVVVEREGGGILQAARLRIASLWSLTGQRIDLPYAPARFEAAVLGVRLTKTGIPASFSNPGSGTWVLLKTVTPDELYLAFDLEHGKLEFFPKTPLVPNDAAMALYRSL